MRFYLNCFLKKCSQAGYSVYSHLVLFLAIDLYYPLWLESRFFKLGLVQGKFSKWLKEFDFGFKAQKLTAVKQEEEKQNISICLNGFLKKLLTVGNWSRNILYFLWACWYSYIILGQLLISQNSLLTLVWKFKPQVLNVTVSSLYA